MDKNQSRDTVDTMRCTHQFVLVKYVNYDTKSLSLDLKSQLTDSQTAQTRKTYSPKIPAVRPILGPESVSDRQTDRDRKGREGGGGGGGRRGSCIDNNNDAAITKSSYAAPKLNNISQLREGELPNVTTTGSLMCRHSKINTTFSLPS